VLKRLSIGLSLASLLFALACSSASNTANTNATMAAPGPDNSEITTTTDENGTRTETRTFSSNPRVAKVVVTTRNGQRTTTVYSKTGESKEINDVGDALSATGDKLAEAAGWVGDKTETAADKTKEGAKEVADKSVETAKTAGEKTAEAAKTVGEKSKEGAKTVANKTTDAAKKTGKTIKRVVTP
jgi:hypothetical protein